MLWKTDYSVECRVSLSTSGLVLMNSNTQFRPSSCYQHSSIARSLQFWTLIQTFGFGYLLAKLSSHILQIKTYLSRSNIKYHNTIRFISENQVGTIAYRIVFYKLLPFAAEQNVFTTLHQSHFLNTTIQNRNCSNIW